jgi:uncharacterized membrane protein YhaH (DUF805 family)
MSLLSTLRTTATHTFKWNTRAGRREFCLWTLITSVMSLVGLYCLIRGDESPTMTLTYIGYAIHAVLIVLLPTTLSVNVRRFHDLGLNGWVSILFLVPFAFLLLLPAMLFKASQPGINRWGE